MPACGGGSRDQTSRCRCYKTMMPVSWVTVYLMHTKEAFMLPKALLRALHSAVARMNVRPDTCSPNPNNRSCDIDFFSFTYTNADPIACSIIFPPNSALISIPSRIMTTLAALIIVTSRWRRRRHARSLSCALSPGRAALRTDNRQLPGPRLSNNQRSMVGVAARGLHGRVKLNKCWVSKSDKNGTCTEADFASHSR